MIDLGTVNELTSMTVACSFFNAAGSAITPVTSTYRVDTDNNSSIVATTSFTPPNINITSAQNAFYGSNHKTEKRIGTIHWTYGSEEGWDYFTYTIQGLQFAP